MARTKPHTPRIVARKKRTCTPREMAEAAVRTWFGSVDLWIAALVDDRESLLSWPDEDAMGHAFDDIEEVLTAADVKQFGPITEDQDVRPLTISRTAGYLIGVQVGLQLRARGRLPGVSA